MKKSAKQRDQKRSAKERKKAADKTAATKQKEQYASGFRRTLERDRERERRRRNPFMPYGIYGSAALHAAALEHVISDFEDKAQNKLSLSATTISESDTLELFKQIRK